ncbi:MAG TPA: YcaO-like family protein [Conexibacter sp.]|nr:YcaO-like family protein [Conexibacter sp.]
MEGHDVISCEAKRHRRGTHRLVPPGETWARISPLLPGFGITRVADVTGLDEVGIPVFQAVRPAGHILAVSQGKGVTAELARISAAMESIEGWHAERVRPGVVRGSAREVGPLPYALRDLTLVPGSLVSDELVIDWLDAVGLVSGRPVLVPRDCVLLSKLVRPGWVPLTFDASSNGLGSGNSMTEAALHGLCEAIESDCVTRAGALPRAQRRRVDPTTVDDPICRELLALLTDSGNAVEVFDVSTELEIPCFMASIVSDVLPRRFSGAGCHPDAAVALSRALTEAAQGRLTAIAGVRDDLADLLYDELRPAAPARTVTSARDVQFRRTASLATDTLEEDLTLVAERVHERTGVEPLLVDLSHPQHGIPVVMAIAPGLVCRLESLGFGESNA